MKVWGRARVVEDDPALLARFMPGDYRAKPEQVVLFTVDAWDVNCQQHIPQKLDAADVRDAIARLEERVAGLEERVAGLEAENAALRAGRSK